MVCSNEWIMKQLFTLFICVIAGTMLHARTSSPHSNNEARIYFLSDCQSETILASTNNTDGKWYSPDGTLAIVRYNYYAGVVNTKGKWHLQSLVSNPATSSGEIVVRQFRLVNGAGDDKKVFTYTYDGTKQTTQYVKNGEIKKCSGLRENRFLRKAEKKFNVAINSSH